MSKTTTLEDFEKFKLACEQWISYFGLHDFAVAYEFEKLEDAQGEYWLNVPGKLATIRFNKGKNYHSPELIAKHEVIECLLLGRLKEMASVGKFSDSEIEEETHRIVRILENRVK